MLQPPTQDEIRKHTRESSNRRIDDETRAALDEVGQAPEKVRARLDELDTEWDVDRALMLNFAIVGGLSAALAMRTFHKEQRFGGWAAMFFTQIGFLAHHAIRRWCPPMPVFRRLGFRSSREICAERSELERRIARIARR